ncbi:polysaccharide pyruvyl transferase family protein [Flavobacterium beibuense]|uniref:Polysaccharide pyruvyl transferase family protein n=1 Tax=Flavobacterium beibuense TaxID=657326 RepID=A0A444WIA2_9FLAO|nr:polysaccharide pyruvyl transferase family protein [Flavobacterium beibuense]RYJ45588.1 polysaccharide pyruvyl transferase family protein [Flavobacterium beibuense]
MKRILVVNEGFSNNLGDQAIKKSLVQFFEDRNYLVDFSYYSNPKIQSLPKYDYFFNDTSSLIELRLKLKSNPIFNFLLILKNYLRFVKWYLKNRRFIKNLLVNGRYDYVVIGGGQLINTTNRVSPSLFSIAAYTWSTLSCNRSKLVFLGVGVAGKFNVVEKKLYKIALNKASKIWVRDKFSNLVLSDTFNIQSEIIPDVVFYDESLNSSKRVKQKIALVGIYSFHEYNVKHKNQLLELEDFYLPWVNKVKKLKSDGYIVELFYTTKTDAIETITFQKVLYQKYDIDIKVLSATSLNELYLSLLDVDFVYSGRMHALIFGLKAGCKVEAFITSDKLQTFNDEYIIGNKSPFEYREMLINAINDYFVI